MNGIYCEWDKFRRRRIWKRTSRPSPVIDHVGTSHESENRSGSLVPSFLHFFWVPSAFSSPSTTKKSESRDSWLNFGRLFRHVKLMWCGKKLEVYSQHTQQRHGQCASEGIGRGRNVLGSLACHGDSLFVGSAFNGLEMKPTSPSEFSQVMNRFFFQFFFPVSLH